MADHHDSQDYGIDIVYGDAATHTYDDEEPQQKRRSRSKGRTTASNRRTNTETYASSQAGAPQNSLDNNTTRQNILAGDIAPSPDLNNNNETPGPRVTQAQVAQGIHDILAGLVDNPRAMEVIDPLLATVQKREQQAAAQTPQGPLLMSGHTRKAAAAVEATTAHQQHGEFEGLEVDEDLLQAHIALQSKQQQARTTGKRRGGRGGASDKNASNRRQLPVSRGPVAPSSHTPAAPRFTSISALLNDDRPASAPNLGRPSSRHPQDQQQTTPQVLLGGGSRTLQSLFADDGAPRTAGHSQHNQPGQISSAPGSLTRTGTRQQQKTTTPYGVGGGVGRSRFAPNNNPLQSRVTPPANAASIQQLLQSGPAAAAPSGGGRGHYSLHTKKQRHRALDNDEEIELVEDDDELPKPTQQQIGIEEVGAAAAANRALFDTPGAATTVPQSETGVTFAPPLTALDSTPGGINPPESTAGALTGGGGFKALTRQLLGEAPATRPLTGKEKVLPGSGYQGRMQAVLAGQRGAQKQPEELVESDVVRLTVVQRQMDYLFVKCLCRCQPGGPLGDTQHVVALFQSKASTEVELREGSKVLIGRPWHLLEAKPGNREIPVLLCSIVKQDTRL